MAVQLTYDGRQAYNRYIKSPEWQDRRLAKLKQTGHKCQACGSDERLEVHHLSYDRLGWERLEELQVICHWCHSREHGRTPNGLPAAGPTTQQLNKRVRDNERTHQHQQRVAETIPILRSAKLLEDMATEPPTLKAKKRMLLIARELHKLAAEHTQPT